MKSLRVVFLLVAVGWTSAAWAQYGLYGSPEMVRFPQVQTPANPAYGAYPAGAPRPIDSRGYAPAGVAQPLSAAYMVPSNEPAIQPPNEPIPTDVRASGAPTPPAPVPSEGALPPPTYAPSQVAPSMQPVPEQGQGMISRMLEEAGCTDALTPAAPGALCGSSFGQSVCAPGTECAPAPVYDCEPKKWFATVRGLFLTRNHANRLWTTYETDNNPNQIPTDAHWDWRAGGEVRFGRWFGAGCASESNACDCYSDWLSCDACSPCDTYGTWAVEGVYWTTQQFEDSVSRSIAGWSVSTPLIVDEIFFGGSDGRAFFDGAREHRVERESEIHNVEINVIAGQPLLAAGTFGVNWYVGARYFRFADEMSFGSLQLGRSWGQSGGIYEAYMRDRITNDLVGGQFGFNASYLLGYRLRVFLNPTLGIYNNHMQNRFEMYRGDGLAATTNPFTGTYPVTSSKDVPAFMSQIDVGLDWQFARNWSANIGYRLLFASGIGLADEQIPTRVNDIPDIAEIDYNGTLVLHGAFAGLTWRF